MEYRILAPFFSVLRVIITDIFPLFAHTQYQFWRIIYEIHATLQSLSILVTQIPSKHSEIFCQCLTGPFASGRNANSRLRIHQPCDTIPDALYYGWVTVVQRVCQIQSPSLKLLNMSSDHWKYLRSTSLSLSLASSAVRTYRSEATVQASTAADEGNSGSGMLVWDMGYLGGRK